MPAFAADFFGPANIGSIYGLMLTAWGFAGVLGPTLIARIREATEHYTDALDLIAVIMLVGAVIPFLVGSHSRRSAAAGHEIKLAFDENASIRFVRALLDAE